MKIRIAHSPDSDDAFMFYALARGKIDTGGLEIEHVLADIETLNNKALAGEYEVTAISFHAYPYIADRYLLLPYGASMGYGYGPVLVARRPLEPGELKQVVVGVPGKLTTAALVLRLFEPEVETSKVPFDQVLEAVRRGDLDAGLLIHEGQLTYRDLGLYKVLDLGAWWLERTGLPLPLGGNAARRDLGGETLRRLAQLIRRSIEYAMEHRGAALEYALPFARGMDKERTDKFVGMYVNEWTLDCGASGRCAVELLLDMGYKKGILPGPVKLEMLEWQDGGR